VTNVLFDVEKDTGDRIVGYLVPDSYSTTATVVVTSDGRELATLPTHDARPSVVAAGRHDSGLCGFTIDGKVVPDLVGYQLLELRDQGSDLVFYRRRPASVTVPFKLFRLEPRHVRSPDWDEFVGNHFQVSFANVDRMGRETMAQTLLIRARSSYISARLLYREHVYSIDDSFRKICIVQDPFVELAEMLLELRLGKVALGKSLDMRDQLSFAACIDHFSEYDITDAAELRRSFARMPDEVETALSCPLTRSLAAKSADEHLSAGMVASAVESLASFDVIGIRNDPDTYLPSLSELLTTAKDLPPLESASAAAMALAELLRNQPEVAALIDLDLDVYHILSMAFRANVTVSHNLREQ
jgi:hypothetical protein